MPKLVSHEDESLTYEVLRRWKRGGHEVALIRFTNRNVPDCTGSDLMCECDFDLEDLVEDGKVVGKVRKSDPYACHPKKAVRKYVMRKARRENASRWREMGLKETLLDIHARVKNGEFLGQSLSGCVYTQEVAELLGRPHEDVLVACGELYAEERLDLNGRILADFTPGFRFPAEMAAIMRYVVEEPLGWPNGDAGDCWVSGFESEVQERHGFKSGKEAFGAHWPSIDPTLLAEFALEPVAEALLHSAAMPLGASKMERDDRLGEALDWDGWKKALARLAARHPDISPEAFREFLFALMQISFDRIEMDRAMRSPKIPPEETLREMAEYFTKLAARFRERATKG